MKVYFVRHGESTANRDWVFRDGDDVLTTKGCRQSKCLAERVRNIPIDKIISSTFKRAKQTAEIISNKIKLPVEYSDLLVERERPPEILEEKLGSERRDSITSNLRSHVLQENWHYSNEENYFDLRSRALKARKFIEIQKSENLLVITHGTFLRMLIYVMFSKDTDFDVTLYDEYNAFLRMHNTGITLCEFIEEKSMWLMLTWNDSAHLG